MTVTFEVTVTYLKANQCPNSIFVTPFPTRALSAADNIRVPESCPWLIGACFFWTNSRNSRSTSLKSCASNVSRNGSYVTYTVRMHIESREILDSLGAALAGCEGVKYLL